MSLAPELRPAPVAYADAPPLLVDLEDLVRTDLRLERFFGQSRFDVTLLPFDVGVLTQLRAAREAGRRLVLRSRLDRTLTEQLAAPLKIFDAFYAGSGPFPPELATFERLRRTRTPAALKLRALVRALRPHQWTKNLLVFIPAILG